MVRHSSSLSSLRDSSENFKSNSARNSLSLSTESPEVPKFHRSLNSSSDALVNQPPEEYLYQQFILITPNRPVIVDEFGLPPAMNNTFLFGSSQPSQPTVSPISAAIPQPKLIPAIPATVPMPGKCIVWSKVLIPTVLYVWQKLRKLEQTSLM